MMAVFDKPLRRCPHSRWRGLKIEQAWVSKSMLLVEHEAHRPERSGIRSIKAMIALVPDRGDFDGQGHYVSYFPERDRIHIAGRNFTRNFPNGKILLENLSSGRNIPDRERLRAMDVSQIGSAVRNARRAQGLRQDQLAGAAGVGLRFIVDLEAGKPTIQLGKTMQVLATLGLQIGIDGRARSGS